MDLPARLKIGPLPFQVAGDLPALNAKRQACGDQRVGNTDTHAGLILVDPTLPPAMQADTLLHEVLHAIHSVLVLRKDRQSAEEWIGVTATLLLGVLRDNPDLVAFVTQPDAS